MYDIMENLKLNEIFCVSGNFFNKIYVHLRTVELIHFLLIMIVVKFLFECAIFPISLYVSLAEFYFGIITIICLSYEFVTLDQICMLIYIKCLNLILRYINMITSKFESRFAKEGNSQYYSV
jgi:hypothetical protein